MSLWFENSKHDDLSDGDDINVLMNRSSQQDNKARTKCSFELVVFSYAQYYIFVTVTTLSLICI
ncbi:hypothetical protein BSQ33_14335 [Vibrio gazogenes]|uniref:Uncharacterized protein n=1 Tax=Vibrio gazogenes TaxID=687 RepID=A0A1Z2SHT9_VIBGA|nr:hypothetical protein BSQ33_14335 [Vibrio gazogenes]